MKPSQINKRSPRQWLILMAFCTSVGFSFVPIEKSIRTLKQRPFQPIIPSASTKLTSHDDDYQVSTQLRRIWHTSPITEGPSQPSSGISRTWTRTLSGYNYNSAAIALKRKDLIPARALEAITLVKQTIAELWWLSPILLCLVPLISQVFFSTLPATPAVWKLVNLPALCQNNAYFVAGFLASNVSYLASAATLVLSKRGRYSPAAWILAAGLVSSAFHAVQTFGAYNVAEAWCYLDHGVAITAILYFIRTFGLPNSRLFWATTLAGLLALIAPTGNNGKIYTVMHSTWHVLSATAAALWALDHRTGKTSA